MGMELVSKLSCCCFGVLVLLQCFYSELSRFGHLATEHTRYSLFNSFTVPFLHGMS